MAALRIRQEILSVNVGDLIEQKCNGELSVPAHQRAFIWTLSKQIAFVKSVQEGSPTSGIIQRVANGQTWLEDGLQRITTLERYFTDAFPDHNGKLFSTLSNEEKNHMSNYTIGVIRYRNATQEQAIRAFDTYQNGSPLSVGQRMYALKDYPSPLVSYAYNKLLVPGTGYHDRAAAVWGNRCRMDKKCGLLTNAVTIISGLAFNSLMTKKWEEIQREEILYREIGDVEVIESKLDTLLKIYEEVGRRAGPTTKTMMNQQWKVGNIIAYIIYSLNRYPDEHERLKDGWIDWLIRYRRNTLLLQTELHKDVGAARSWNEMRWRKGYMRVFDPQNPDLNPVPDNAGHNDSEDDDEESE
jgi:hypothetical protein